MKPGFLRRDPAHTAYIILDTRRCTACWNCLEICPNHVIDKIDLPWHKHARIVNGRDCTGCLKCVTACSSDALNRLSIDEQ